MNKLTTLPIATFCLAVAFVLIVGVGGVLCLRGELDYEKWGQLVVALSIGLGLLGIGRGRDSESKP